MKLLTLIFILIPTIVLNSQAEIRLGDNGKIIPKKEEPMFSYTRLYFSSGLNAGIRETEKETPLSFFYQYLTATANGEVRATLTTEVNGLPIAISLGRVMTFENLTLNSYEVKLGTDILGDKDIIYYGLGFSESNDSGIDVKAGYITFSGFDNAHVVNFGRDVCLAYGGGAKIYFYVGGKDEDNSGIGEGLTLRVDSGLQFGGC